MYTLVGNDLSKYGLKKYQMWSYLIVSLIHDPTGLAIPPTKESCSLFVVMNLHWLHEFIYRSSVNERSARTDHPRCESQLTTEQATERQECPHRCICVMHTALRSLSLCAPRTRGWSGPLKLGRWLAGPWRLRSSLVEWAPNCLGLHLYRFSQARSPSPPLHLHLLHGRGAI